MTTTNSNRTWLFAASCIALVATAMTFAIRGDTLGAFGQEFDLSYGQRGLTALVHVGVGFPIAILLVGPLCDTFGMGRLLMLACFGHIVGVLLTIFATGFPMLLGAAMLIGLANGTVEAVINPLCATMFAKDKTSKLNILHAWWPGGLVIGGVIALLLSKAFGLGDAVSAATLSLSWKVKWGMILIPSVIYGLMIIGRKFPMTERAEAGISTGDMFKEALRPGYLLILLCMCLTATTELGPNQWVGSVLADTVGIQGIWLLVYTSGLMFVLRFYAGPIAHKITPFGLLLGAAAFSAVGLFWLSYATTSFMAFAAATVFGIGVAYFWPTMLGVTSERYPRGGALLMAMTGAAGMIAAGQGIKYMGGVYDANIIGNLPAHVVKVVAKDGRYSPEAASKLTRTKDISALQEAKKQGAAMSFRSVAILPVILVVLFGLILIYHQSRGGYRAITVKAVSPPKRKKKG